MTPPCGTTPDDTTPDDTTPPESLTPPAPPTLPIRASIAAIPRYTPGRVVDPGPDQVAWKLSSNENPYPPLPPVLAAITAAAGTANRYPDAGCHALRQALAGQLGVPGDRLAFGTGSVALIYQALQILCEPAPAADGREYRPAADGRECEPAADGRECEPAADGRECEPAADGRAGEPDQVITAWRSFEAYPIAIRLAGAEHIQVGLRADGSHDLAAMLAAITDRTRVIIVCSPNNPTGPTVDAEEFAQFVDAVPDRILVLFDEAYAEFVTDPAAARGERVWSRPNVVVLRTFSKAYGLAGFRVGYAVGPTDFVAALLASAVPFGVSDVAQRAAEAALASRQHLMHRVRQLTVERDRMRAELNRLWQPAMSSQLPDSQGNFVWLPLGELTDSWVAGFAAGGVSVRGFSGDGIRISVAEPAATKRVLELTADLLAAL